MKKLLLRCLMPCLMLLFLATAGPAQAKESNPIVVMETTMGRVIIMLYANDAPITVSNFLRYVNEGFYNGTIFHRIVRVRKGMQVIQGGGFDFPMQPKRTHAPIPLESAKGLINKKGTIAMARGATPDSATSQFFFNLADNENLDYFTIEDRDHPGEILTSPGYCAFGKVVRGMDVLEKILTVKTRKTSKEEGVPIEPVFIKRMYVAQ